MASALFYEGEMRNWLRSPLALLILAGPFLMALTAYHQHAQKVVLVTFEGPWAFAPDPNDANHVFAFAPKTKSHHDLVVETGLAPSQQRQAASLPAGIYELALPSAGRSTKPDIDANVLQTKIDAQGVQHALSASDRYAIRLPKPEAYVASSTERSRAGSVYPPAASTEKDYVVTVSLRYRVATLNGFRFAGKPDDNTAFNPLSMETPVINFAIQPLPGHMMDSCNLHAREAFRDLAKLVNIKLFVDFPDDPSACRAQDPKKPPA
jgi:hypothetical protein